MNGFHYRPIRHHEQLLLRHLAPSLQVQSIEVRELGDGGMGSIGFGGPSGDAKHHVGSCQFIDVDGTPVIVDLFLWEDGRPAELGFWKVDYSTVEEFPRDTASLTPVVYKNAH